MSSENRCPECGSEMPHGAPSGLCPACLLKKGLETNTFPSVGGTPSDADFTPPTPAELAPHFPDLEILELIGRGGMGMVYRARQKKLDRLVALKILSPKIGQYPAFADRFKREATAMAMLSHPHIVTVHDFGQCDSPLALSGRGAGGEGDFSPSDIAGHPSPPSVPRGQGTEGEGHVLSSDEPKKGSTGHLYYFIMEYIDGVNLRRLLNDGKLSPKEALAIVPQICEALQYAHDKGVVHRDIKPENILLGQNGQVKIADFGLAKLIGKAAKETPAPTAAFPSAEAGQDYNLTGTGQVMGTPYYMAPEQTEHPRDVDHRADIYSLGVVFYQMLTGELPLGRFAPPSKKVLIDVRLDEVVLRALEKEPDRRYQQVSEIKTRIETIAMSPSQSSANAVEPRVPESGPVARRFSKNAIVGVAWAPLFFVVAFLMMSITVVADNAEPPKIEWWQYLLRFVVLPLGVLAPFGTTILGAVSLSQIRHSGGRLYGLGVALFDTLLFPLLLLDAIIGGCIYYLLNWWVQSTNAAGSSNIQAVVEPSSVLILTFMVSLIVGIPIAIKAWKAVSNPTGDRPAKPFSPPTEPAVARPQPPLSPADRAAVEQAMQQVQAPAIGLLILGILHSIAFVPMVLLGLPFMSALNASGIRQILIPTILLIWLFEFILMIVAAVKMKQLRAYGLSVAASILSILSGNPVGIAIGIWALVVLNQLEVRKAFWTNRSQFPAKTVPVGARRFGLAAFLICLLGVPLAALVVRFIAYHSTGASSWADVLFISGFFQLFGLFCGLLGRKSALGKTAIVISLCILVPLASVAAYFRIAMPRTSSNVFMDNVATVDVVARPNGPWTANLPAGSLELAAVSRYPSCETWWLPNGREYPEGTFQFKAGTTGDANFDSQKGYVFVLRPKLSADASLEKFKVEAGGVTAHCEQTELNDLSRDCYMTCLNFSQSASTATVRFSVGYGPWENRRICHPSGSDISPTSDPGYSWFPLPAEYSHGKLVINLTYPASELEQVRIVAIDKQDAVHQGMATTSRQQSFEQMTVTFDNLHMEEVKEFQFQARPWRWVEFRNVSLQPTSRDEAVAIPSPLRSQPERTNPEKAKNSWSANLKNGSIEVVGVSRHPVEPEIWWKPDGSYMPGGPFELSGRFSVADESLQNYVFMVHLPIEGASIKNYTFSQGGASFGIDVPASEGRTLYGYSILQGALPKTAKAVDISATVATGPWETIETHGTVGFSQYMDHRVGDTVWNVSFAKPIEQSDGNVLAIVTHNKVDQETRLIAIDNQGKECATLGMQRTRIGNADQLMVTFKNIKLDQIKEFRFQARPCEQVEFRNVALTPNFSVPPKNDATERSAFVFGATKERVIGVQDADEKGLVFFSLRNNKVVKPPVNSFEFVENSPEQKKWIDDKEVDLFFRFTKDEWFCFGLGDTGGCDPTEWKAITADMVANEFRNISERAMRPGFISNSSHSSPYLAGISQCIPFRACDNKTLGLYQINGVNNNGTQGVWIRWKLIEKSKPENIKMAESYPANPKQAEPEPSDEQNSVVKGEIFGVRTASGLEKAFIDARLGRNEELLLFYGKDTSIYAASAERAKGEKITASIDLDRTIRAIERWTPRALMGKRRIIYRTPDEETYIGFSPFGRLPDSELIFREPDKITQENGVFTFADFHNEDGLTPLSIRIREKAAGVPPSKFPNPSVPSPIVSPTAPPESKTADPKPQFGPVIERVIDAWQDTLEKPLIDLDTGELLSCPAELKEKIEKAKTEGNGKLVDELLIGWIQTNGGDAVAVVSLVPFTPPADATATSPHPSAPSSGFIPTIGLRGLDLCATGASNDDWDRITPLEVESRLSQAKAHYAKPDEMTGKGALEDEKVSMTTGGNFPATFLFQTREGGQGVLQILSFNEKPKSVKIRYKLVRKPTSAEAAANAETKKTVDTTNLRFTPVIERNVGNSHFSFTDCTIDLDTGKLFSIPEKMVPLAKTDPKAATDEMRTWMRENHIDSVGTVFGPEDGLDYSLASERYQGLFAEIVPNDAWENLSEENLSKAIDRAWADRKDALSEATAMKISRLNNPPSQPATYIFETREQGKGILQVLGHGDQPKDHSGVKIRYKLLRKPVPAEAAAFFDSLQTEMGNAAKSLPSNDVEIAKILLAKYKPQIDKFQEMIKGTVAEIEFADAMTNALEFLNEMQNEKDPQKRDALMHGQMNRAIRLEALIHGKPVPKELPLPSKPTQPQGPTLFYGIDPDSKPSEVNGAIMETVLKVVERRMNPGKEKIAEVSLVEGIAVGVHLMRDSDEDKKRVERLMARSGTLEFRILATDRDKEIVELAKKVEAKPDVHDADGKKVAFWVPFANSSKDELAKYSKNIVRTRKEGDREIAEVLVLIDHQNVTGAYIAKAEAKDDERGMPCILFNFNEAGSKLFGQLTGEHLPDPEKPENRYQLGIILDGKLYSAPNINATIYDSGQITGNFTKEEAADIADLLNAGSLPVKLVPVW